MTRSRSLIVGLVIVAIVAVGGYVAWDQVLRGDAAAPLALPSSSPDADPSAVIAEPSGDATPTDPQPPVAFDGDVTGTWNVTTGSQAGYRVREQLASLPAASDAVGRTDQVTGTIEVGADPAGATLLSGEITVDAESITSDESRRDDRLRTQGLETAAFPTASFTLTTPVDVPAAAVDGTASDIELSGDLTLHGVTRSVVIPAQTQLVDGRIEVAGSITFPLADFDIVAPNVGGFILSIADEGTLEFVLVLVKG